VAAMAVRSLPRRAAAALLLGAALAAASGIAIASPGSMTRPPAWSQIRTFSGAVTVIASVGRSDAWLTGIGIADNNKVFVQHWNGARWHVVSTPHAMFTDEDAILGASSAANAWVFTFTRPAAAASYAVGWHWTGRAWRSYRLPAGTSISATAVISPTDAWAFGMIGAGKPYVIRYDGRKWRRVPAPVQPTGASALNGHDIWVVGPTTASLKTFPFTYEAADWTGTSWRTLKLPHVRIPKGMYAASPRILAVGPADIWIDFDLFSNSGQGPGTQTLLHYDAGKWAQVSVPHGSIFGSSDLATDGRGGIWLALAFQQRFGSAVYDYRSGHWSKGAVLAKPGRYTIIASIARVPGTGRAWAAGYAGHTTGTPRTYGVLYEYRR
jgi:hypothetical protein